MNFPVGSFAKANKCRLLGLMSAVSGAACVYADAPAVATPPQTVIRCDQLFDSETAKIMRDIELVIEQERIVALRPATNSTTNVQRAAGLCLPGYIDLHTHLTSEPSGQSYTEAYRLNDADMAYRAEANGMKTLRAGFTSVRDLGDGWGVTVSLRNAIAAGTVTGPRIFTAGKAIGTTGGHADPTNGTSRRFMGSPGPDAGVINGPDEARQAVRQRYKESSDLIKITATGGVLSVAKNGLNPQFEQSEMNAIVATAKDYGLTVAAHAHGPEGMKRAVLAGVTSIEHGTFMTPEIMTLMKQRQTWYVPTMLAGAWVAEKAEVPGFYLPIVAAKARSIGPQIAKTLAAAYKAGVPIAFGTDAGVYPHGMNAREFALLHDAGVPIPVTIQMATVFAAQVLNESSNLGALSVGRYADITVVAPEALTDAALLAKPLMVFKGGVATDLEAN
jgi:imidazolonepropionase-like amidohydrolase